MHQLPQGRQIHKNYKQVYMKLNINNVSLIMSAGSSRQFPTAALPQIAFSGRSNVGKSSLINALLQRKKLARVSSTPGKTITINFYNVDNKMMLVDLPGYGYARRTFEEQKKWSALTDGYFTNNPSGDLIRAVIQLIDSRIGPTKDDLQMLRFLEEANVPHILVYTKADKLNRTARNALEASLSEHHPAPASLATVFFSSETKEGRDALWDQIYHACSL